MLTFEKLLSNFKIMKKALTDLQENAKMTDDKKAVSLLAQINKELLLIKEKIQQYENQVDNLSAEFEEFIIPHPNEIISAKNYSHIKKYRALCNRGCDAKTLHLITRLDGVTSSLRFNILSELYDLSQQEIRKIIDQEDDWSNEKEK